MKFIIPDSSSLCLLTLWVIAVMQSPEVTGKYFTHGQWVRKLGEEKVVLMNRFLAWLYYGQVSFEVRPSVLKHIMCEVHFREVYGLKWCQSWTYKVLSGVAFSVLSCTVHFPTVWSYKWPCYKWQKEQPAVQYLAALLGTASFYEEWRRDRN